MPNSVQVEKRGPESIHANKRTTFGTSARNFIDLPKDTPAPSHYRPVHFTEASHAYSIPRPPQVDLNGSKKGIASNPGPGAYDNMKEMSNQMHLAKSMLGGSTEPKKLPDNGNPGPGAY